MVTCQGSTRSELPCGLLALCRRIPAVNAIGMDLRDPINPGLTRSRKAVQKKKKKMDTAAELGRNPVSKHQIQPEYELSRLTRDGTAKPVSRDQILTRERGQEHIDFPCSADHVQDWQPYPVMHTLAICVTIHKDTSLANYSNTVCSTRVAAVTVILLDYNRLYNYGIVCVCVCVCVCFLPIHSGHQVRWTYQPGSHRRKLTQDFSCTFFLQCVP